MVSKVQILILNEITPIFYFDFFYWTLSDKTVMLEIKKEHDIQR